MEHLISVIVCTYNQEATIARTLDAILMQQCHVPFEIILSDDCSSDNTLSICKTYAEQYPDIIRLIANTQNKGVVKNYFDCILEARGQYIADCAGDDWWIDAYKLEKEVSLMEQHPNVNIVLTRWNWYNVATRELSLCPPPPFTTSIVKGHDALEAIITQTDMSVFHLCSSLYRRDIFLKASHEYPVFFNNSELVVEDIQLVFMMAYYGDIAYLPDVTMNYSVGSLSASTLSDDERQFRFVRQIMSLCHQLTQHFHLSSKHLERYFSKRLFTLSMHAFRSHNRALYLEVQKCEKELFIKRSTSVSIAYLVMRYDWLWRVTLLLRRIFVTIKRIG